MSTESQRAGWTDSLRLSRRTLLRFLPRRLANGHQPLEAEIDSGPPAAVESSELRAHTPQQLGRFLERLASHAATADAAAGTAPQPGADSGKDDRGPEEKP